jgi:hypothetical protein
MSAASTAAATTSAPAADPSAAKPKRAPLDWKAWNTPAKIQESLGAFNRNVGTVARGALRYLGDLVEQQRKLRQADAKSGSGGGVMMPDELFVELVRVHQRATTELPVLTKLLADSGLSLLADELVNITLVEPVASQVYVLRPGGESAKPDLPLILPNESAPESVWEAVRANPAAAISAEHEFRVDGKRPMMVDWSRVAGVRPEIDAAALVNHQLPAFDAVLPVRQVFAHFSQEVQQQLGEALRILVERAWGISAARHAALGERFVQTTRAVLLKALRAAAQDAALKKKSLGASALSGSSALPTVVPSAATKPTKKQKERMREAKHLLEKNREADARVLAQENIPMPSVVGGGGGGGKEEKVSMQTAIKHLQEAQKAVTGENKDANAINVKTLREQIAPLRKAMGKNSAEMDKLLEQLEKAQSGAAGSTATVDLTSLDFGSMLDGMIPAASKSAGKDMSASERAMADMQRQRLASRLKFAFGYLMGNQGLVDSAANAELEDEDAAELKREQEVARDPIRLARTRPYGVLNMRALSTFEYFYRHFGEMQVEVEEKDAKDVKDVKGGKGAAVPKTVPLFPELGPALQAMRKRLEAKPDDEVIATGLADWIDAHRDRFVAKDETLWTDAEEKKQHPFLREMRVSVMWEVVKFYKDEAMVWHGKALRSLFMLAPILRDTMRDVVNKVPGAEATMYLFQKVFTTLGMDHGRAPVMRSPAERQALQHRTLASILTRTAVEKIKSMFEVSDGGNPFASLQSMMSMIPRILGALADAQAPEAEGAGVGAEGKK